MTTMDQTVARLSAVSRRHARLLIPLLFLVLLIPIFLLWPILPSRFSSSSTTPSPDWASRPASVDPSWPWSNGNHYRPSDAPVPYDGPPIPDLRRDSRSFPPRSSQGVSRVITASHNGTEEFAVRRLPTLTEAYRQLDRRFTRIRDPLLAPWIPDEMVGRYEHLKEVWNDVTRTHARDGRRRWFLVTLCKNIEGGSTEQSPSIAAARGEGLNAGLLPDWFATWTVLADFLGPETLVFSLYESGSDDGS